MSNKEPNTAAPERIWINPHSAVVCNHSLQPEPQDVEYVRADLTLASAGQGEAAWIVSVVMIKHDRSVVNTHNKLYKLSAANLDEAQGKAIKLAQSDFPQHSLHTVCGINVSTKQAAAAPSSPARQPSYDYDVAANVAWLKSNRDVYAGQWVAIRDGQFIDADRSEKALRKRIGNTKRTGILVTLVSPAPDKGEVARRTAEKLKPYFTNHVNAAEQAGIEAITVSSVASIIEAELKE